MAPKARTRRSRVGTNWDHHRPSRCIHSHFFKIILPSTMQDMKLRLPEKFVREHGDKLSGVATLAVPNGCTWQVRLEKANNNIWFHGGWRDFVEYHSINYGYFLVFKYKGNSKFNVLVFDMTTSEIKYPYNGDKKRQGSLNENEMSTPQESCVKEEVDTELIVIENLPMSRRSVLSGGGERALQAARTFKPKNPSFIRVIPAYSLKRNFVYVCPEFAKKYACGEKNVKLQASSGKWWPCQFCFKNDTTSPKTIGKGWKPFARDNGIKEGDVCVFELINRMDVVLKVSIYRVAEYA
ncbi:B3 domain-containing transcription factor VRN1-like isoform X2 [Castanea sativa]|uniref:B3 domain-containing transcription factor VRN1-like isoform X2 n=1 Tax=Castanea sativa TaxID=21020 RepID=UPI003F64D6F8